MFLRAVVILTICPLFVLAQDPASQDQTPQDQTAPAAAGEAQPTADQSLQAEAQDQTPGQTGQAQPAADQSAQPGAQDQTPAQNGQAQRAATQPAATQPYERPVSFNPFKFAPSFFSDEAKIWSFPVKAVGTGHHLLPALAVAGITAGLVFVDPTEGKYFRQHAETFHTFNNVLSEKNTD
jgi:hypothetical protein